VSPAPRSGAKGEHADLRLAAEHVQAGRLDEAGALLAAVEQDPSDAEAIHCRGMLAMRLGRADEAAALMARSIEVDPAQAYFRRNLCEVYRILGRYDDALAEGLRAAEQDPDDPLVFTNLSVLHYERLEPDAAVAAARRTVELDPDLPSGHFGLAEALLLKGELEEGWEEYEWRYRMPGAPPVLPAGLDLPQWDGARLQNGRLLLVADQGFGDAIQFARYIPWAAERCGGEVAVAASCEMQPLIGQIAGVGRMFAAWADIPACDAYAPLSGLPRLAGTRLETIRAPVPYLRPDPDLMARWRARVDGLARGRRRIGLVWAGRPSHRNDRNRSTTLKDLGPLWDLEGVTFVSLQVGPAAAQVGGYFGRAPLVHLGPEIGDFADTLAILAGLDLLITVDTAVAHLAGAAGVPAWVMLPHAPDWRWLTGRSDSPWYPSLRLFRPPAPRDWGSVAAAVARSARAA
jgi:hypothetical protein